MSLRWRPGMVFYVDPDTPGMDFTFQWADWLEDGAIESFEVVATDGIEIVTAVQDESDGTDITVVIKRSSEQNDVDTLTCRVARDTDPVTGTDRSIRIRWAER